ncbi:DUF3108 domain-containing protein [Bacteroides sp. 224]|uniref:DUF3108 domain-containing protein n=1 Tax=Bacteroides sp. 224 TaxID=2302936 RepID=UPI0013D51053|nr:DUF3108 domain-containing protein [Bacteroides sp. 224]NDV65885.1 DUF3108 domain-containing protein [Bacteroides sp. 224]
MNQIRISIVILLGLLLSPFSRIQAQCERVNNAFKEGEVLSYDLYFKYGLLYTKAGRSSLTVTNDYYNGQKAYKMKLTAKSSGVAKKFFSMSDTLTAYTTKAVVPLAYMKDAHESKDHTIERATYQYNPNGVKLRTISRRNNKLRYDTIHVSPTCMYDMLSILYYVRTINYDGMKKGDEVVVPCFSGRSKIQMSIQYEGTDKVSANDKRDYNCHKLVLIAKDDAFENGDEAMKVYITNDANKIPIRIESKLKVGSTRVILNGYEGLRN